MPPKAIAPAARRTATPYRLGNMLIGNTPGAAVLECTLRGAALQFETDTVFALTGAVSPAALDGVPVPYYAPLFAKAGSTLQMGMASTGLRSYLAVGGGIATLPVLGSRATDLKCCIGGLDGRKLAKGDTLPTGLCDTTALWQKIITCHLDRPLQDACITTALHPVRTLGTQTFPLLRAVPGPQDAAFTSAGLHIFTHGVYQLTPNCDRMACKLAGPAIEMKYGADILSDGIAAGSVQISADSQPIVILTDHQTTGGYAKIATVISADLPYWPSCVRGRRWPLLSSPPPRLSEPPPAGSNFTANCRAPTINKEVYPHDLFRRHPRRGPRPDSHGPAHGPHHRLLRWLRSGKSGGAA